MLRLFLYSQANLGPEQQGTILTGESQRRHVDSFSRVHQTAEAVRIIQKEHRTENSLKQSRAAAVSNHRTKWQIYQLVHLSQGGKKKTNAWYFSRPHQWLTLC
ncbi:hypothetical protein AVEN_95882-1 [Araneus ventricosus]|uniref:Uncharacterized protein n=1 Tax=Araneus ventricosus TaxID=182803 RepID=A0A4Y2Q582_ARAVE|nr:hypothetical protein AVEN_95882-1 [Araneus ventricosus]